MDYNRFFQEIPHRYENWGQESVKPKNPKFQEILAQWGGMTTANVMQLLNLAVECMNNDEIYCQVGIDDGSSLIGALVDFPNRLAYAVDDFDRPDITDDTKDRAIDTLMQFNFGENLVIADQDLEEFLLDLKQVETQGQISVYFDNSHPNYRSVLLGLLHIKPILTETALIIISHSNSDSVHQATWDFIATHPQSQILLDLPTFGNGIKVLSWDSQRQHNYETTVFIQNRRQNLVNAIATVADTPKSAATLYQEAIHHHQQQQFAEAEQKYHLSLRQHNDSRVWFNLGILYCETARYEPAINAMLKSLELSGENRGWAHYYLGIAHENLNQNSLAIAAYQEAIQSEPDIIDAWNHLGNLLVQTGNLEAAEPIYRQAIDRHPQQFGTYVNLGNLLLSQGSIAAAIEQYQAALNLSPGNADIFHNLELAREIQKNPAPYYLSLAENLAKHQKYSQAIEFYDKMLALADGDAAVYESLGNCYWQLRRPDAAITNLQKAVEINPNAAPVQFNLINYLLHQGRTAEAISQAETAAAHLPADYTFTLLQHLIVPMLYHNVEEISYYRQRFEEHLQILIENTRLDDPEMLESAVAGIGRFTNFYLAYQTHNVIESQRKYGNFVHQIMVAKYPQWVQPLPMPPVYGKIRVGYISNYLYSYSGSLWLTGWMRYANRSDFEIYFYHTGNVTDKITEFFRTNATGFYHIPGNLEQLCQQIRADNLHILVFPEIGMDPPTLRLAGLRLAPVQCTAWGHPVTSGMPTIDYFLSSELMEPENAQEHYSEKLILLPNIGVAYPRPQDIPELEKTRTDYDLPEDAVIYLCCQAPFKYLPQYDYILAAIARRVPGAKFLFFRGELLKERLAKAFAAVGLNSEDYCLHKNVPARYDYLMLNRLSDVFLDTFTWSGGNTSLEAIACHLPIVTCPGEFMRGRHADSFLKMMGVTETIAQTPAEYIEIAVQLGLDPQWRRQIAQRLSQRQDNLFDDQTCVAEMEAFYRQVVKKSPPFKGGLGG
ncbi:MAG TPA: tetratricopeptide repeat protein [Oscillatoriaceae cyanobacterium M33_DOE_052]|uniref:protein O-GlcNAc transferase n=1 Tax=Planktothricoides sp. SpSt-374 TaxID=2282167 RepID=A0A7C3ZUA2_9CYAN|nr:tetratricopeptide repeat protein [Oscillatoriaceae cyanobacterium M33_DOE_052]